MLDTALSRCTGLALAACTMTALAADKPPSVLKDPIIGLRYDTGQVRFERLPAKAIADCETLRDNENRSTVWYLYAQVKDAAGRKYFIIGGYEIRHDAPSAHKYQTDGRGVVLFTNNGMCTYIDSARQVFEDRLFDEELPEATLIKLAADFARRLAQANGGADNLRIALNKQHFRTEELPPELLLALQPYLIQ